MVGFIDIKTLNLDELIGVVNLYPWYGGARMELCRRMTTMGDLLSEEQLSTAALYLPRRELVRELLPKAEASDYSDKDIQTLLRSYFDAHTKEDDASESPQREIYVVGGDYFTQAQYKNGPGKESIFSIFAAKAKSENEGRDEDFDLCTEALAEIYSEQGYPEEARKIYEKLAVKDPSKSVYYATLIEKL